MHCLIVYDFDGVIAESEVLANSVLAEIVTELGVPTTLQELHTACTWANGSKKLLAPWKRPWGALPATFASEYQARTLGRFREGLQLVNGVRDYIDAFAHVPRCIASSSSPDRLALCLEVLGLQSERARLQCLGCRPRETASRYIRSRGPTDGSAPLKVRRS